MTSTPAPQKPIVEYQPEQPCFTKINCLLPVGWPHVSVMLLNPDPLLVRLQKLCTLTNLCIQHILYRDTAPVQTTNSLTGELSVPSFIFVPRLHQRPIILATGRQKHAPYLACHRDYSVAEVPRSLAGWRRQVTQPPFIAGPLGCIVHVFNI